MTWWRRDPTLSPVHRCAQHLLRSHEAALRTRCFSRTPSKSAQHEDGDGGKRPASMSNLEWMQLQHYTQWRKRLTEDPYRALFGASSDMLNGKGLKDWEWISKSFPSWMVSGTDKVEETKWVGHHARPDKHVGDYHSYLRARKDARQQERSTTEKSTPTDSHHPNIDAVDGSDSMLKRRVSHFPQPSFRPSRLDQDDSGITSPSDLRRPQEQPRASAIGQASAQPQTQHLNAFNPASWFNATTTSTSPTPIPPENAEPASNSVSTSEPVQRTDSSAASREASARESPFIEEFFADELRHQSVSRRDQSSTPAWRQTALQRRSSPALVTKPESRPAAVKEQSNTYSVGANTQDPDWLIQQNTSTNRAESKLEGHAAPTRSTAEVLKQLPEEDIDFLSAADIRASMGRKGSKTLSNEEKQTGRQELEEMFKAAYKGNHVDPMIESGIINDQYVRRLEREMREAQDAQAVNETASQERPANPAPVAHSPVEHSIDRMKKWMEQGGAILASHFWQDPTEEADAQKTKLFFDKVVTRIRKGRVAMREVVDDLEIDISASKPLLKRLKQDEELLDSAIHALRLRSASGNPEIPTPKKLKAIQQLRLKFQDTDRELDAAYAMLRQVQETEAPKVASPAFQRRLIIASRLSHKSAHLTRYLIWSLQARLEDPGIGQSSLTHYKAVANSLLTLRDTQMALARLVDRAMLVYGVEPKAVEDLDTRYQVLAVPGSPGSPGFTTGEPSGPQLSFTAAPVNMATIRADVAAEERLANEVEAQKLAMRGLSDDGYARAPKPASPKIFDEGSPLAHSLFRPFGPVLESLGKETPEDAETVKANEDAEQKLNDAKLVAEVKEVYEDTYGPITVGHRQLADATEGLEQEQDREVKKFEMLKEDPVANPSHIIQPTADDRALAEEEHSAIKELLPSITADTSPVEPNALRSQSVVETSSDTTPCSSLKSHLPTHYTILIYDPQTDRFSLTTSTTGPPRDTSPALPLHQALSTLDAPAKFVPYIIEGLEIVSAKKDMLVLRDALDADCLSTRGFETVSAPRASSAFSGELEPESQRVNPIDGTARLSPTGYVGPEESQEQLEKEVEGEKVRAVRKQLEKHAAGDEVRARWERKLVDREGRAMSDKAGKKRVGAGGVVRTAIWAAAVCYVVGVCGEICLAPFKM